MHFHRFAAYLASTVLTALVVTVSPGTSAADEQFNWRTYSYPDYGFTVMFPMEVPSIKTIEGSGTPQRALFVRYEGIVFQVNVAEAAQPNHGVASVRAICDAMRQQMMSVDGVVRVYRVFQTKSPACEIVYDTDYDETISVRLHIAEPRLYQTFVRGPRGYDSSADAAKFQDSFHVLSP